MNLRKFLVPMVATTCLGGAVILTTGCRKNAGKSAEIVIPPGVVHPALKKNAMGGLPGAVYQSAVKSAIHWQPWAKETMDRAKDAKRLVLCVVVTPQQPGFQGVLKALERHPSLVTAIHENYVPVLVDGEASREIGLLTADLCAEIKRPLQLPLFVWMTHEGNPVAWIPVSPNEVDQIAELFNQYDSMVSQTWKEDPGYVITNSGLDNANRRARLEQRKISKVMSEQPAVDVLRSLRQLASLYDPFSRTFDETGGLFPASSLELLSSASLRPGVPEDVRNRCRETATELLVDLLPSAMFDPLDGGVFHSRRGISWALPSFSRDCPGQARIAVALLEAHRATGNPQALEKALGLIDFAEKNYSTPEGLFSVGLSPETDPEHWLWSVEDVEKALGPADSAWWIQATRMKGLGNLPSEVDPQREFFRGNTLGLAQSPAGLAAELGKPAEEFTRQFEAARQKLLAVRNARLGDLPKDDISHAGASFRMVSAYAAAFTATGEERYREKAVALLKKCREAFGVGPRLRVFSQDTAAPLGAGRAFLYALALQSVLDVSSITSDEQWLVWSEDLATTAAEMFTGNGFLKECPDDAKIVDLPVTDLVMLFDDSTAGLVSAAESRLAEIGRPLVASFSELATPMPTYAMDRPVLHTDLLLATLVRHYKVTILMGEGISQDMKQALERLPMRTVQRRPAKPTEAVAAGSVKILLADDIVKEATTVEALQQVLLPSAGK